MNEMMSVSPLGVAEWEGLKEAAHRRAHLRVPKSAIRKRPGRGGQIWEYLDVGWLEEHLDEEVPGWSFTIQEVLQIPSASPVAVVVRASLVFQSGGVIIRRDDMGGSAIKVGDKGPISVADDFKSATTDAFRRCCYRAGLARGWRRKLDERAGEMEREIESLMASPCFVDRQEEVGRYYENAIQRGKLEGFIEWMRKEHRDR